MPADVTNYQCPACTGPLQFVGASGKLECEHCGNSFDVATIEVLQADKEQAAAEKPMQWATSGAGSEWSAEETSGLRVYSCPSCGAEIICDETTAATSCVYCGNPTVVPSQLHGNLKPDYVIPFRHSKASAVEILKKYYKKKKFLPGTFAAQNHVEEIKGVYAPFWLFDGRADADVRFRATRVRVSRSGNTETTTTDHYRLTRKGNVSFEKIPVDGSTKMPDAHMDAIEPFDYNELKPFSTAYLPGFLADKYDQDATVCAPRANARISASAESAMRSTVSGYTSVQSEYVDIDITQGDVKYALLPVWLLSTKWNGKNFLFAMNGQTGKMIGDLPIDWGKFFVWFFGIAIPIAGILMLITIFLM